MLLSAPPGTGTAAVTRERPARSGSAEGRGGLSPGRPQVRGQSRSHRLMHMCLTHIRGAVTWPWTGNPSGTDV